MTHSSSTPTSFGPSRLRLGSAAPVLLALAALVGGCGGETDPHKALQAGDGETAAKLFQKKADAAKPLDDAWCRATFFRVEALATYDKTAAKAEADAILAQHGAALGETRARDLADHLGHGGAKKEALEFLNSTVQHWPDSFGLDAIHHSIFIEMRATKDGAAALESLAYTGGATNESFVPRKDSKTPPEKLQQPAAGGSQG
jgi:hypothetical protein